MRKQRLRQLQAAVITIAVVLMGVGPFPAAAQGEQVVVEIGAGPKINPGECTIVEWIVEMTGDWTVTLDGEPVEPRGHREVCPRVTTAYTLQVEAPGGPISKQATVVVGEGPAGEALTAGEEPPIYFQVVEPEAIPQGTCAKLAWEVGVGEGAAVTVNGQEVPPAATVQICPQTTSSYELAVEHPEGVTRREIILTVMETVGGSIPKEGVAPPETEVAPGTEPVGATVLFAALPDTIVQGACAVLHWSITPPQDWTVLLDGQRVASPWEQKVCPQTTTTYQLVVEAPTETIHRSVTLNVVQEPGGPPGPTAVPPVAGVEPTATPPAQPPQPPQPPPAQPGAPAQNQVDLAVTDLFADKDIQGTVHVRVTNRGPATLSNSQVELKCGNQGTPLGSQPAWSHTESPWVVTLDLKPGETSTLPTKMVVDTSQYNYDVWCSAWPKDHTEANDQNNRYDETITRVGAAPQPPATSQPPPMPPGGSSWGVLDADLAVTDLYADNAPDGSLMVRFTNRGPDAMNSVDVPVTCQVTRHLVGGSGKPGVESKDFTANVTLNKGQTGAYYSRIELYQDLFWYEAECTIKPGWKDENPGNNSYQEKIKAPGP